MSILSLILPATARAVAINAKKKQLSSEADLVKKLQAGEKAGLEILYDRYSSSLNGIISRIIRNEDDAEDILQETFVKIWRFTDQYDADKGRLFTWMANIARNVALDHLKSKSAKNNSLHDDISDLQFIIDGQHNTSININAIGVKQILLKLKPQYKSILDLVYFKGYTHLEAAEELGIPVGTIKTRMRMAVNILRESFN